MTNFLRKVPIVGALIPPKQPRIAAPVAPAQIQQNLREIEPSAVNATEADKLAAQTAAAEKRKKIRGQSGRGSTVRTTPLGASVPAGNIARKTLLGG